MGQRDFARKDLAATTNNCYVAGGVVRGAKGAGREVFTGGVNKRMDFGDGDLLGGGGWWQEVGGSFGEQGFAGAGWTGKQDVVVASYSDRESTLGESLAADMVE